MRKIILLPFSIVYATIIYIRNKLYDSNILKSTKFTFPIICIGNLSVGGTGKTPHTNYLINLLKKEYNIAVLSRGFNRKTKGYVPLNLNSKAINVGDEPLFYKWKHPNIKVSVCEDRVFGISQMTPTDGTECVYLLDDAFQHRAIKAGLNIILTEYSKRYTKDYLLPSGNLREFKSGAKRTDIIIVTKCPTTLSTNQKNEIIKELEPEKYQHVFFSKIIYKNIYPIFNNEYINNETDTDVILISGIANPKNLVLELETRFKNVYDRSFSDHYNFKNEDIDSIIRTYKNLSSKNKIILTTEKDATRLFEFRELFLNENINIFCIPIEVYFDLEEKNGFDKLIKHYLDITLPKIEEENIENILNYDE